MATARQHQHRRQEQADGVRQDRQRNPQQPVAAHLQQNPGQDHAPRSRCFGVRIRKPRVHGEHRHLHGEGCRERDEEPRLLCQPEVGPRQRLEVERAARVKQRDEADEHQEASRQREDEELQRGVNAARPSPHADEQEHGNDHELPEHVEEEEIRRRKQPDHRGFGNEQRRVELPHAHLDGIPRHGDAQHADQCREADERQADAVDAHAVGHVP